jgi:hypothetical protein
MAAIPSPPFELYLFTTDLRVACEAVSSGITGLVVDWEYRGKAERQQGYDTAIGSDTVDDLRRLRDETDAPILCRINPLGEWTSDEVEMAVEAGASEILLPMVRSPEEVLQVLGLLHGRRPLGILIETRDALERAQELARIPIFRAYVGLNDLAIDRGVRNIFLPLVDGTLEAVRSAFRVPFGFGGLTLPDRGYPVPSRLLLSEMARLECRFAFLRRSFLRDVSGRPLGAEVQRIRDAIQLAFSRSALRVEQDRRELREAVIAATSYFESLAGLA